MGHVVPITPSLPVRLAPLLGYKQNDLTNFHSPYTLPSSVSCKSCVCHSYENTGGVGVFFPFWNSSLSICQPSNLPRFQRLLDPSPFLSNSCALFCTFLHSPKAQLFHFQSLPHSSPQKTHLAGSGLPHFPIPFSANPLRLSVILFCLAVVYVQLSTVDQISRPCRDCRPLRICLLLYIVTSLLLSFSHEREL